MSDRSRRQATLDRWVQAPSRGAALLLAGIAGTVLVVRYGQTPDASAFDGDSVSGWGTIVAAVTIITGVTGLLLVLEWWNRLQFRGGNRRAQIGRLTKSLSEALSAVDAIRMDIAEGEQLLAKLESQAESRQQLVNLTEDEVKAVRALLQEEFQAQSRSSLLRDVILSTVFFALGLIASIWLGGR